MIETIPLIQVWLGPTYDCWYKTLKIVFGSLKREEKEIKKKTKNCERKVRVSERKKIYFVNKK